MKEAPLLIRWGIPGTIFFGALFCFALVDVFWVMTYHKEIVNGHFLISRLSMDEYFKENSLVGIIAFLIGASIPIGFIISQLYYFGFWANFPFRSRRSVSKILTVKEIEKFHKDFKIKQIVDIETHKDFTRGRELVPNVVLVLLYILRYCFYICFSKPLNFIVNIIIKLINKLLPSNHQLALLKREYRLLTPRKVKIAQYEWVSLEWYCKRKATAGEITRLENLGHIFHGIGTTYVAVFLAWLTFSWLHLNLPTVARHSGGNCVRDNEIMYVTITIILFLFFVFWHNRKDAARHQLLIMRAIYDSEDKSLSKTQ